MFPFAAQNAGLGLQSRYFLLKVYSMCNQGLSSHFMTSVKEFQSDDTKALTSIINQHFYIEYEIRYAFASKLGFKLKHDLLDRQRYNFKELVSKNLEDLKNDVETEKFIYLLKLLLTSSDNFVDYLFKIDITDINSTKLNNIKELKVNYDDVEVKLRKFYLFKEQLSHVF